MMAPPKDYFAELGAMLALSLAVPPLIREARPRGHVRSLAKPSSNRKAQLLEKALRRQARAG